MRAITNRHNALIDLEIGVRRDTRHTPREGDVSTDFQANGQGCPRDIAAVRHRAGECERKLLDAMVAGIGDKDVAATIGSHTVGEIELPLSGPERAPLGDERPVDAKHLNSVVVAVRNIHVTPPVDGQPAGKVELSVSHP